jgi:hypothetical protein
MSHRVELHGPLGGLLILALIASFIATVALAAAAHRTGSDRRLAQMSWQAIAAAITFNAVPNLWSALWMLWWAAIPLQALSTACSITVMCRERRKHLAT